MLTRFRVLVLALALVPFAACGGDDGGDPGSGGGADAGGRADGSGGSAGGICSPEACAELQAAGEEDGDRDRDGHLDCDEGDADPDGDGRAACIDDDSDGDGLPDAEEFLTDEDGDGAIGLLDTDSDDDGISDGYEGVDDVDGDGVPNLHDDDSDGDGVSDRDEYGRSAGDGGSPVDRDADGEADFVDLDSDGDGLADADETGCPDSTNRASFDSDGDSVSDVVEQSFGSDPCDPNSDLEGLVDFYFVLPYEGDRDRDSLEFGTDVRRGDVHFNVDTTGSMGGQIETLRETLSTVIIPAVEARLEEPGYGVSHFEDMPCGDFGGGADRPFNLLQRVTTNPAAAQAAVDALPLNGGGDSPEAGVESLYQIATGEGGTDCVATPPFDPLRGFVAGQAEGVLGGVGFRRGSVPIVVHVTDAPTHANGEGGYPYGATRAEAFEALRDNGVRVIGVSSGGGTSDATQFALESGAVVPTCAWDGSRPASCGDSQCCTGINGAGVAPTGTDCPLVFQINGDGTGLDDSVVAGIEALVDFSPLDITTQVRGDPEEFGRSGIDTACFIEAVVPDVAIPVGGACSTDPEKADFDGDGTDDGFTNVTPGSQVLFDVQAYNDCVPGEPVARTFFAYIDVVAGGAAVLDTRIVTILVPPDLKAPRE